jgi:hypothetical protein
MHSWKRIAGSGPVTSGETKAIAYQYPLLHISYKQSVPNFPKARELYCWVTGTGESSPKKAAERLLRISNLDCVKALNFRFLTDTSYKNCWKNKNLIKEV